MCIGTRRGVPIRWSATERLVLQRHPLHHKLVPFEASTHSTRAREGEMSIDRIRRTVCLATIALCLLAGGCADERGTGGWSPTTDTETAHEDAAEMEDRGEGSEDEAEEDDGSAEADCIDRDADGYGSPKNDDLSLCPACENGEPNGCARDCDDNNSTVSPGTVERCDGTDNDCDGKLDEMECVDGTCPLQGVIDTPQQGTSWSCRKVGGTSQCVIVGIFTANDSCESDERSAWGICGENDAGTWSRVPSECTQLE